MKTMLSRAERLALLLHLMGDDAAELARTGLNGQPLVELDQAIRDFKEFPPSNEEIDLVIEDFENYFQMAMQNSGATLSDPSGGTGPRLLQIPEETFEVDIEPTKRFEPPRLTGDNAHDLNQMHPYQVAQALKKETATATAIVLRVLANEHAAKTLEYLPEQIRPKVFLELSRPSSVKPIIQERVLQKALEMALTIEEREKEQELAEQLATLVRTMPRELRGPMLDELIKDDTDLADAVKDKLYQFEDLKKLEDRDLQKLLGQCQTEVLVVALQQVEEEH